MHPIALLGKRKGKHLHLRELMDAVEPARRPAVGTGLGAEAVADPAERKGSSAASKIRSCIAPPRVISAVATSDKSLPVME